MWLYPLPNLVALFGWIFLFATSGTEVIAFGLGTLALGVAAFFAWSKVTRRWPFGAGGFARRRRALGPGARAVGSIRCRQPVAVICSAVAAFAFTALCASAAFAQPQPVRELTAVRAVPPPVIDGRLDDAVWAAAVPVGGFLQRDPDEGKPATEETYVRIAFDDHAVYVAAEMRDRDPSAIVRQLSRRDVSVEADALLVYLDPHNDHLTGAQFGVSAAGVQRDALIYNDNFLDATWDAVWESAVETGDHGWTVEMRIPLSQLRFPKADRYSWGINVQRVIQRRNESAWLQLVRKNESGLASRMAHLEGIAGINPPPTLEFLPYVTAREEFIAPAPPGSPFNDGSRFFAGAGLDLKYGLSSSLTLDATFNPDFGQVEVDPAVVNLTQFETFFEERATVLHRGRQGVRRFRPQRRQPVLGLLQAGADAVRQPPHRPRASRQGERDVGRRADGDHDSRRGEGGGPDAQGLDARCPGGGDRQRACPRVQRRRGHEARGGAAHQLHRAPRPA